MAIKVRNAFAFDIEDDYEAPDQVGTDDTVSLNVCATPLILRDKPGGDILESFAAPENVIDHTSAYGDASSRSERGG